MCNSLDPSFRFDRNRNRFVTDDFDLDLTYITRNIIGETLTAPPKLPHCSMLTQLFLARFPFAAMSFPATGLESTYRNHMNDVAKLLTEKHPGRFLVFNLSERVYDISKLDNQVRKKVPTALCGSLSV